jgi:hypothetical protein
MREEWQGTEAEQWFQKRNNHVSLFLTLVKFKFIHNN